MRSLKTLTRILATGLLLMCATLTKADMVDRRGILVTYDSQSINDGFGNIRIISVKGSVRNTTDQDAAVVNIQFKLVFKNRKSVAHKLDFQTMPAGDMQEFQFETDLENQPDQLVKLDVDITKVKFTSARKASPISVHNVVSREVYSLSKLNEEGRFFVRMIEDIKKELPFTVPVKDEFETTDEYESRVNFAENEHFSKCMDLLEKHYGDHLGGKGAVVRFLPQTLQKSIIYSSETTVIFQIPVRLGSYNADVMKFEDLNLSPRTTGFAPPTLVPPAELTISHEDGFFFLKLPYITVSRESARIWRKNDDSLITEMELKMGVIQDGPYCRALCYIPSIKFKNSKTLEDYLQWGFQVASH
jgi:hypothetical protein